MLTAGLVVAKELVKHFRKYGREGGIILADGKKFFPSANHDHIYERHNRLIINDDLRAFSDAVIKTVQGGVAMPLGVEPSQAEMVAYTSEMDIYLSAQRRLIGGHYMDDFQFLVEPNSDYGGVIVKQNCNKSVLKTMRANMIVENISKILHYVYFSIIVNLYLN